MLKSLSEKKALDIFKEEFNANPTGFSLKINEIVYKEKYVNSESNYEKEEVPLFVDILLNTMRWKDIGETFNFLKEYVSFYDTSIKKITSSGITKRSVLIDFIKLLKNEDFRESLEEPLVNYLKTFDKDNLLNLFKNENFDIRYFAISNRLNSLVDMFPEENEENAVKKLISIFNQNKYCVEIGVNVENVSSLSKDGKKMFIESIFNLIDEDLLRNKIRATNTASLKGFCTLLSRIKNLLDDKTKSDLLRRVPQLTYYREISSAISMKFNSSNFIGTPWDRLIEISLYNREIDKEFCLNKKSTKKNINFITENAWNDLILKSKEKFLEKDNYMGKDVVFAFMSFYKKTPDNIALFEKESKRNEKIEIGNGPENLLIIKKTFKDDNRILDFIVDEFNNNPNFINKIVLSQRFKDNVCNFEEKIDFENIRYCFSDLGNDNSSVLYNLKTISESGLNFEKVLDLFNKEEINLMTKDLFALCWHDMKPEAIYSLLKRTDKNLIVNEDINNIANEGLRIALSKIQIEYSLDFNRNEAFNESNSFKI